MKGSGTLRRLRNNRRKLARDPYPFCITQVDVTNLKGKDLYLFLKPAHFHGHYITATTPRGLLLGKRTFRGSLGTYN